MAELCATRCFMKWGVFDMIPSTGSISYKDLAEKIGAEESLISKSSHDGTPHHHQLTSPARMAWIMVSTGVLEQIGEDQIAHTRLSKVYTNYHPSGIMFQVM
jgi:hypothetical protein